MKKPFLLALLAPLFYTCGEAGVGFNVGKEFPVTVPVEFVIPGNPLGGFIDVDPPAESFNYNLNNVDAFADALNDLQSVGSIIVEGMAYEIQGDLSNQNLELDLLSITLDISGSPLTILEITSGGLTNTPYTSIDLTEGQKNTIVSELAATDQVNAQVDFDLASLPAQTNDRTIQFDFIVYFDVTLKARNIGE